MVEHAPSLNWDLGDARGTVAVRMPLHPVALELLELTGPMAVSSANRTGQPPALTVQAAREQLGEDVQVYLDGGPAAVGVASTIVDVTTERASGCFERGREHRCSAIGCLDASWPECGAGTSLGRPS